MAPGLLQAAGVNTTTFAPTTSPLPASTCQGAVELGYELYAIRRELHAHALRLTRSQCMAEDLVQDTVERALRFEHYFVRGTNLKAWAHQILSNLFVSGRRKHQRETRALQNLSAHPCAWPCSSPGPEASTLSPGTQRALDSLPAPFRAVVELVDVQDLSYRDAAARLEVPIGTVMSRLHRGRRMLADALREPLVEAA